MRTGKGETDSPPTSTSGAGTSTAMTPQVQHIPSPGSFAATPVPFFTPSAIVSPSAMSTLSSLLASSTTGFSAAATSAFASVASGTQWAKGAGGGAPTPFAVHSSTHRTNLPTLVESSPRGLATNSFSSNEEEHSQGNHWMTFQNKRPLEDALIPRDPPCSVTVSTDEEQDDKPQSHLSSAKYRGGPRIKRLKRRLEEDQLSY